MAILLLAIMERSDVPMTREGIEREAVELLEAHGSPEAAVAALWGPMQ